MHWLLRGRRLTIHSSRPPLRGGGLTQALGPTQQFAAAFPQWVRPALMAVAPLRLVRGYGLTAMGPRVGRRLLRQAWKSGCLRSPSGGTIWACGELPVGWRPPLAGSGESQPGPNNSFKPNATSWRRLNSGVRPHAAVRGRISPVSSSRADGGGTASVGAGMGPPGDGFRA